MPPLRSADAEQLLQIADAAIVAGLEGRAPEPPSLLDLPQSLREPRGVFVTVTVDGELNGCIGSIEAEEPLAIAVTRHAWSAAFADPRLPRLTWDDHPAMHVEVSVLSTLEPLPARTRDELLDALEPGVDGLVIDAAGRRAVFLPSVWEQLREPGMFVAQLQWKAGLRPSHWPPDMRAWRFTAEKVYVTS
jgi:AmmeMemoRadiSam system protein A